MSQELNDENIFKILIVTDTHIGFMERDAIRGNDSYITWEEVLQHAQEQKVDFILHGGDLFHDNKPSRKTLFKTMELIRKYCLGESSLSVKVVSDQSVNFPVFKTVNYEDPNYNISIPIYVIHGNHDDPAGDGQYSALDLLSVSNLVNYFGKSANVDNVTLYPILMEKGSSKLAMYGLGNIRDERLHRTFQQQKVQWMKPAQTKDDEWFNLMVLHQNRAIHHPKNSIHENMLESFLNLVVWGHEHECLITPTPSAETFFVTQPGSTIATSLSPGESVPKHIGLLEVCGQKFKLTPIPLTTVRPFVMKDIVLSELGISTDDHDAVREYLVSSVEQLIESVASQSENSLQPLVRIRVDYSGGFSTINPQQFGQQFVGRVANPIDILLYNKKRIVLKRQNFADEETEAKALLDVVTKPDPLDDTDISELITSFLISQEGTTNPMSLLVENEFNGALHKFVEKDEKTAIEDFVKMKIQKARSFLMDLNPNETKEFNDIQKAVTQHSIKQKAVSSMDDLPKSPFDTFSGEKKSQATPKLTDKKKQTKSVIVDLDMDEQKQPKKRKRDLISIGDDSESSEDIIVTKKPKLSEKTSPPVKKLDLLSMINENKTNDTPQIPIKRWGERKKQFN